ncbi:alanine racemase [Treponema sp.]|uniref:alanine racemase n=1 Tax=Treponema sp. TaxID=166 RepID=UPI00388D20DE
MRPTIARIYLENLRHNLKVIRSKIQKGAKMCVAIKADAYGHGAVQCAKVALECGVDYFAVSIINEGLQLREAGIKCPILVLSLCSPDEMDLLVEHDLTPLVFDEEYITGIAVSCLRLGKKEFPVHLAVDTGMGRIGCLPEEAAFYAKMIEDTKVLKLGGMCTHFSVADSLDADDIEYSKTQFERFLFATEQVKKLGIDPGIRHCANSALTLNNPEMHLDMCRPGIICYGYYPGDLTKDYFNKKNDEIDLKPVMALVSKVVAIRKFGVGHSISYGRTWTSSRETDIGVIPIGYDDGLFRRFNQHEGSLKVAVAGKPYPVRGRICMDQCMIDLGKESDVQRWDDAVIFGPENSGALQSAEDIARATNTISYEITCGISKRVPRVYIG